jgi:membrane protein DedA with SNARE-associated domain
MTSPAIHWLPLGFHDWMPVTQAATLGLLTFVQEDVPTVSAALLAAAGSLSWQTGFLGVFLGIWMGDALLYLLARSVGRPLLQHSWAKRFFDPAAVARSEQWFAGKGTWLLLSSRFVPGTRLPTYLAAGFLRLPFGRFLLVTGAAVAAWTVGIFLLARTFGDELLRWLQRWNSGGLAVVLLVIALAAAIRLSVKLSQRHFRRRIRTVLGRWMRWEFWPAWLFYLPVGVNYLWLAIRHRGFTLPTAANPGIFSGGFVGESKIATLRDLHATSPEFTAEAVLLPANPNGMASPSPRLRVHELPWVDGEIRDNPERVVSRGITCATKGCNPVGVGEEFHDSSSQGSLADSATLGFTTESRWDSADRLALLESMREKHGFDFPFILKPDVGQRGVGVKLIRTPEQAAEYLQHTTAPLVVQRYAPGPCEAAVFYYRFPHESHGRIFAITEKIFPTITGDGKRTVEELVWEDERARFVAETYLLRLGERRSEVLSAGETLKLVEAGNHAQGCIFREGSHLWSDELERRIDELSQRLDGFFIGRYDIRYASDEDLRAGRNFHIIELNGAASEATSIYDARNSLFSAYRTLFRQWELVFAIGAANRQRGCLPTAPTLLWRKWRETTTLIATYPLAD